MRVNYQTELLLILPKFWLQSMDLDISLGAAMAAIQLAEKYSAELVILYVIDSKIRYETIGDDAFPRYLGSLKQVVDVAIEKGQKLVDEVKEKVNGNKITIKTEVTFGGRFSG